MSTTTDVAFANLAMSILGEAGDYIGEVKETDPQAAMRRALAVTDMSDTLLLLRDKLADLGFVAPPSVEQQAELILTREDLRRVEEEVRQHLAEEQS